MASTNINVLNDSQMKICGKILAAATDVLRSTLDVRLKKTNKNKQK